MITNNVIGDLTGSLRALTQQLTETARSHVEFESGDPNIVEGVVKVLDEATILIEDLRLTEERIASDSRLSALGQKEAMAKVAKDIHGRAKFIEKAAIQKRDAWDSERKEAFAVPKPASVDAVVTCMKEQEQRQRLRTLSLAGQMRAYIEAVQKNEVSLIRSIKDPSFASEMLADKAFADFVERIDRERIEFKAPQTWARLTTLEKSAQWLTLLWSTIDLQLSNYGQMPAFHGKPTRTTDLGQKDQTAPPPKNQAIDKPQTHIPPLQ